jgi:hypothetical protein
MYMIAYIYVAIDLGFFQVKSIFESLEHVVALVSHTHIMKLAASEGELDAILQVDKGTVMVSIRGRAT